MPYIETQGLSHDYSTATGSFDTIERGNVSNEQLLVILEVISKLSAPETDMEADVCPPSVQVAIHKQVLTFHGESGMLHCIDSVYEEFSPNEALQIINGEISIEEFDISKGHQPKKNNPTFAYILVIVVIFLIASLWFILT